MHFSSLLFYTLAFGPGACRRSNKSKAVPTSLTFNIDLKNSEVYEGEHKTFFGYKVLQFISGTNKGILVTAPLQKNGTGGIYKLIRGNIISNFSPEELSFKNKTIPVKHLGLSITQDVSNSQFIVCSPSITHECYDNTYLNGVCYKVTADLEQINSFTPFFQECTKKTINLVFLFDGSGSMNKRDFEKNKHFIEDIMKSLMNSSIKFAAVQFSTSFRTVFDFRDYDKGDALKKLYDEPHMAELTNTHRALQFVLENVLENRNAGASSDATRVLVLITDGDPSDRDHNGIINKYDEKNIIRFVIGVKIDNLDKVRTIASNPKEQNAFKIENYNGLTGLLENLQKKIFKMEDSKLALAGDLKEEMSQNGFSAAYYKDTLVLGSVGSNSWRGSLYERHGEIERQIEDPIMHNDSYMGYAVSSGMKKNTPLYFTGAPRYDHTGQVVFFRQNEKNWTVAQRINGDQIGSYFGAELCTLDVNTDGDSDFLLVGAPMFFHYQERAEGQIYIYSLTDGLQLKKEDWMKAPSMGRFGTTIASLADLNGDGLKDVAVGAPLEDENSGVVYIYLGDRNKGIRSDFSQRIMGRKIKPGLRFFGQAINGDIDLGEDGLPDIVVGSDGAAVVLRSWPVLNVMAHLSFQPKEINTDKIDCLSNTNVNLPMANINICFVMEETTKNKIGGINSGLNISYFLNVDPTRKAHRGFFKSHDRESGTLTSVCHLREWKTCINVSLYMPTCVKDTLSPVVIKLNFSQVKSEGVSAFLNLDSKRQTAIEVPFKKECKKNDTCIADLEVDFSFEGPSLFVAEDNRFKVSIKLTNHGDDSYNTNLTIFYPPGLSFSSLQLTKATRPTLFACDNPVDVLNRTTCGISLPVYRSQTSATFMASFHILNGYQWNDTASISVTGQSDNSNSSRASLTKSLPVQFEAEMAITVSEDTISYLNFTLEDKGPKKIFARYMVANLGVHPFPVSVSLMLPTKLGYNFEIKNYHIFVQENRSQCTNTSDWNSKYCSPEKHCKIIVCDSFIMDKESTTEFTLSGDAQFREIEQYISNIPLQKRFTGESAKVQFKSFIHVNYDKQRYVLDSHKNKDSNETDLEKDNDPTKKLTEIYVEFVIPLDRPLIIATGSGLGFLLLIIITIIMYKCGCFKRKTPMYNQEQQGQEEEEDILETNKPETNQSEPDTPAEKQAFLEKDDCKLNGDA